MYRLTFVFSSLLLIAVWSAPIDAAEEQRRARRRDSGTTQTGRAPQRSAPARRAPAARQQRGGQNGGSTRRATPRRAPRRNTAEPTRAPRRNNAEPTRSTRGRRVAPRPNTGDSVTSQQNPRSNGRPDRRGRAGTRVVAPAGRGSTGVAEQGRTGRNRRNAAGGQRRDGGVVNRRPPGGNVVGRAVSRPPLTSRPIVINNYGGGRGRGRSHVSYTPYYGRYRHGGHGIYGTSFYFPGYSTFNIGFGVGYGSGYYDPYGYGRYGGAYGYNPYAYGAYADAYYTGSLRLKIKPRFGEVLVDGYYVGLVNDYDGIFQRLRLEEGPHRIEIREPGFEPLAFDVLILPGETITYEGYLIPLP